MNPAPRPLDRVIVAVLKQVPEDYQYKSNFAHRLAGIIESIPYTAPEGLWLRWEDLMEACNGYLGEAAGCPWKETIEGIVTARLNYVDYL